MLLPHESTVATGGVGPMAISGVNRYGQVTMENSEDNLSLVSPDEAPGSAVIVESAKNERMTDDETKKKRVRFIIFCYLDSCNFTP